MLINVKMPTKYWHFNIYEQDKSCAQLGEHRKSFITSGPGTLMGPLMRLWHSQPFYAYMYVSSGI